MPKSHTPYPREVRKRMVELVRSGRSPDELAEKFEPTAQSIRNWVAQVDRDRPSTGRPDDRGARGAEASPPQGEESERGARDQRETQTKAAAWFGRQTSSIPHRDSNS